jgi:hypothetical protein
MTSDRGTPLRSIWLEGLWVRDSRSIDGGPFVEHTDVYWLQVGPWFADVRSPRAGHTVSHPLDLAQGFSGMVSTNGTMVTWTHDLDTRPRPSGKVDTADTRFDSEVLVEWAEGYQERWRPGAPHGTPSSVVEGWDPGSDRLWARVVRVGTRAVAVWAGARPGAALLTSEAGWHSTVVVGSTAAPNAVGDALRAEIASDPMPPGWRHPDLGAGGARG